MGRTKRVIRRDKLNSRGQAVIYIKYTHQSKNTYFSVGELIEPKYWDEHKMEVRRSYRGYTVLNELIHTKQEKIDELKRKLVIQGIVPTIDEVRNAIRKVDKPRVVRREFFPLFDEFVEKRGEKVSHNTVKQYKSLRKSLAEFEEENNQGLKLDYVNGELFYSDYIQFLEDIKELHQNTIGTRIKDLKVFLGWCYTNNYSDKEDFKSFVKPKADTSIIALTQEELGRFFTYDFENPILDKVRDIFVFACFTGLRYSDYDKVIPENINGDYLTIITQKTKAPVSIPIIPSYSGKILKKYNDNLNVKSIQRFNRHLKDAARQANLNRVVTWIEYKGKSSNVINQPLHELISSHMARKTFITHSLEKGMTPKDIMRITSHRSMMAFQRYIDSPNVRLKKEMEKAWK